MNLRLTLAALLCINTAHAAAFVRTKSDALFKPSTISTTALKATSGSLGCRPIGIGSAAPPTIITNDDLAKVVETSDEWIRRRTGIGQRRVLQQGESIQALASQAARQALTMSGLKASDIHLVICATSSPQDLFGDATSIAADLECDEALAFDLTAACSGFLFGIVTAGHYLEGSSTVKNALVVGADALSRWVDWDDRNSCILFGDGAGAMVLTSDDSTDSPGVLGYSAHSNGKGYGDLNLR
jgi:3-oxoacyl-[acyl-carrier-protein] synthase-3